MPSLSPSHTLALTQPCMLSLPHPPFPTLTHPDRHTLTLTHSPSAPFPLSLSFPHSHTASVSLSLQILLRCVQDDRFRRKTSGESQDSSPLLPRSLFPRSTVPPPSDAFNSSAYCLLNIVPLFNSVPDSVCHAVSDSSDEYQCWNGKTIGRLVCIS